MFKKIKDKMVTSTHKPENSEGKLLLFFKNIDRPNLT